MIVPESIRSARKRDDVYWRHTALEKVPDEGWKDSWKLSMGTHKIFEGTRFLAYRQMLLNHIVHHRAQLGVYLRLNDVPLPGTYGPSADEPIGA